MTYATATVTDSTESIQELRTVEISFYDHEIYANGQLIAKITYDSNDFVTQPWLVLVNDREEWRANTYAKCHTYIRTHYKRGTLPVQQPETPAATTGNEIQCQIAQECEKQGFELLDDGIYLSDFKVGEVGFDVLWWFIRASSKDQQKVWTSSVADAVQGLLAVEVEPVSCEDLLDTPFDELTAEEWEKLLEYTPVSESNEWIAA